MVSPFQRIAIRWLMSIRICNPQYINPYSLSD
nr:MAG TPA: hypothetical protein [Caudoviricetes sp.]